MSRKAEKQILIRCDLTKNRDAIIYDAFQNRDKVKYQFYNDYLFAAILSLRSREEKPEVTKEELPEIYGTAAGHSGPGSF